jgi:hypothetical protein
MLLRDPRNKRRTDGRRVSAISNEGRTASTIKRYCQCRHIRSALLFHLARKIIIDRIRKNCVSKCCRTGSNRSLRLR